MPDIPIDGQPCFVAEEPEHCHDCYRLICPDHGYDEARGDAALEPWEGPGTGVGERG